MIKTPSITVLYHIFYEDSCEAVCNELQALYPYSPVFLFNICTETPGKQSMAKKLKENIPGCFVIFSSNKGKDIGGKLVLLQLLLQLNISPEYLLMLHDKKSLQALKSATWKTDLLKIILPENLTMILQHLQKNADCGLVATSGYIIAEPFLENEFSGRNGALFPGLLKTYNIHPVSFKFVAGTMFWARAAPMLHFFKQHSPLEIRKQLENDNVVDNFAGTITHSWERLFSWILTSQKLSIKGV